MPVFPGGFQSDRIRSNPPSDVVIGASGAYLQFGAVTSRCQPSLQGAATVDIRRWSFRVRIVVATVFVFVSASAAGCGSHGSSTSAASTSSGGLPALPSAATVTVVIPGVLDATKTKPAEFFYVIGKWRQLISCLEGHPLFRVNGVNIDFEAKKVDASDLGIQLTTEAVQVMQAVKGTQIAYLIDNTTPRIAKAAQPLISGSMGSGLPLDAASVNGPIDYAFTAYADSANKADVEGCVQQVYGR
jgi:hypothetical protein